MVQIKLFRDHTPEMEKFEKQINAFLSEHKDTIIVKDIKFLVEAAEGCGCGRRVSQETLDNGIVDKEWDEEKTTLRRHRRLRHDPPRIPR